jgi:hypothetical protein
VEAIAFELGYPKADEYPKAVLEEVQRRAGSQKQSVSEKAHTAADSETAAGAEEDLRYVQQELSVAIAEWLTDNTAFLICDDAHRYAVQFRTWLAQLHEQGQSLLLLATFPLARDIFLRLPRIELKPLADRPIRQIMRTAAQSLGVEMMPSQLAKLQQRCGGNPMLAQRVVMEEYLGLDSTNPDHTQWIDGTPFLIAALLILVIIRFIGLGLNSTSLYLIGGILTIAVGVIRLLVYSLPRKSGKLGR